MNIERYLDKVAACADDSYGRQFRRAFADHRGTADLAMLASPSAEEVRQLKAAMAIMTQDEKINAAKLSDAQILKIAQDAKIDPAILAVFINGYCIELKKLK